MIRYDTLRYDKPFEVTRVQYAALMERFGGVVAGRYCKVEKKFYIKLWMMRYKLQVSAILASLSK